MEGTRRPISKRHHTVPQFYLRGFAQDEQLTTVRLPGDRRFTQSVGDASVAKHFYSLKGHEDGADVVERALAEVEGHAAAAFASIDQGTWPLPYDERMVLGYFIALQGVRVPAHRRTVDYVAQQLLRLHVGAGGKAGLRRDLQELGSLVSDNLVDTLWEQAIRPEGPPFRRPQAEHIGHMLETAQKLVPFIIGRPWSLVRFERRSLITSDSPVALVPRPEDAAAGNGAGYMTAAAITLPLTRKLGLLMSDPEPLLELEVPVKEAHQGIADTQQPGTTALERYFNHHSIANTSECLFHHPDDARFIPDHLPAPSPVTMTMSPEGRPFDGRPWAESSSPSMPH